MLVAEREQERSRVSTAHLPFPGVMAQRLSQQPSSCSISFDFDNIPTLPPPATSRGHQRSRTTVEVPQLFHRTPSASPTRSSTFLPFIGSNSRSSSPKRVSPGEAAEFDIASTGGVESRLRQKPSGKVERIASWFEGASDPVNIGLVASPKQETAEPFYKAEMLDTMSPQATDSVDSFTRRPQSRAMGSPSPNASRFSFFRKQSPSRAPTDPDELINLDIRDTLHPHGPPEEVSAAAYKSLQLNAEATLRKFQGAYKENLLALRKITSDKNIQSDELEASTTRNEHLKFQLLEMAERAAEQEKLIAALRSELEQQKAGEVAMRSIRLISATEEDNRSRHRRSRSSDASGYADSVNSISPSELSSAVSIFSDAAESVRTPGTSVGCPSPVMKHVTRVISPSVVHMPDSSMLTSRDCMPQACQTQVMVPECQKCHGLKPNEAWDVLSVLKMENGALKGRISELELANESALDILAALDL